MSVTPTAKPVEQQKSSTSTESFEQQYFSTSTASSEISSGGFGLRAETEAILRPDPAILDSGPLDFGQEVRCYHIHPESGESTPNFLL